MKRIEDKEFGFVGERVVVRDVVGKVRVDDVTTVRLVTSWF